MPLIQKGVVKSVTVAELKTGDRLLVDLMGYKDRPIMNQGKVLNNRDIAWIRQKLKEPKPKMAAERYQTKRKASGNIRDAAGKIVVKTGQLISEEAMEPLLKEGFVKTPGMDSSVTLFVRKQEWPDTRPWRIDQFNPTVKIETIETFNDETQDHPEDQTDGRKKLPAKSASVPARAEK